MKKVKRVFFSFYDRRYFESIAQAFGQNGIIGYDRSLIFHTNGDVQQLYDPIYLDQELSHPDLAIILITENSAEHKKEWLEDEYGGLFALEKHRKTKFLIPVLAGEAKKADVPKYFQNCPERIFDLTGRKFKPGLERLIQYIKELPLGKIFIGHGHTSDWKELRDFLTNKLNLECDDFEAVPTAGKSVEGRLLEMLHDAHFAFLVTTAEDEKADGSLHPRENVIHEVGLFQGRLGFDRAIILLEEDCPKFSNASGLIHISFARGKLYSCFEPIRELLKSQGLISG